MGSLLSAVPSEKTNLECTDDLTSSCLYYHPLIPPTELFFSLGLTFPPLLKYANLSLSKYLCGRKLQIQSSDSVNLSSFLFLSPLAPSKLCCWHSHLLVPFSPRVVLQKRCRTPGALFFFLMRWCQPCINVNPPAATTFHWNTRHLLLSFREMSISDQCQWGTCLG